MQGIKFRNHLHQMLAQVRSHVIHKECSSRDLGQYCSRPEARNRRDLRSGCDQRPPADELGGGTPVLGRQEIRASAACQATTRSVVSSAAGP
jgi:hypothetical protein